MITGFKLKIHAFLCLALLNVTPVFAASTANIDYDAGSDFFGEAPVVLTVSRMHKPLDESPASVSIIDRQMIRDSGARQIADIFRMVPGFIVGYYSGNQALVTYQGLGALFQRQMQVLIDGRSVFIPSFGGVPWTNLPLLLEDIERVEITRGPNAVTYGANAFLATINIITRHAAEDAGSEVIVTQGIDKDSSISDIYARYGNNYGDLDWRISAGREQDDGYENVNDSKTLDKINIRADYLSEYNQFWTIQAGLNETLAGRGEGNLLDPFRDEKTSNSYQNIRWEMVQERSSTMAMLAHTQQEVSDSYKTGALNELIAYLTQGTADEIYAQSILNSPSFYFPIDFSRKSDRLDFELFQTQKFEPDLKLAYGFNLRKDEVISKFLFHDDLTHSVDTQRIFSNFEWKSANGYILDLGVMLEDTSYTNIETSHRFSLLRKINQDTLRLVSSTAKRNPILYELLGKTQFDVYTPALGKTWPIVSWRSTNDVTPETINSTEIGIFSEYNNQQVSTDIKIFRYEIRDQIDEESITLDPDPVTGVPQKFDYALNSDNTIVKGIDLTFNYSPDNKQYRLFGGSSFVNVKKSFDDYKESYPDHTIYVGGHSDFKQNHQLSGVLYIVGTMAWSDEHKPIDGYEKLDLRYQYTIDPSHDFTLELIGQNLLDDYNDYIYDKFHSKVFLLRLAGRF